MPVQVTVQKGSCLANYHQQGDSFIFGESLSSGICMSAWTTISPYIMPLTTGMKLPWETEPGTAVIRCPDCKEISMELRRIE